MELIAVTTTVGSAEQARYLARELVQRRLAACAQLSAIESVYVWQGQLQHEGEQRIVFKTTRAAWPALQTALAELHPYALPQIVATPLAPVSEAYARWVGEQVDSG